MSTTNTRNCDAFGCTATVPSGRFLCIRHWRMVSVETQRTINARYSACRKDFGFLSDVAYLQACVDAIRGIARAEGNGIDHYLHEISGYERLLRVVKTRAKP